MNILLLGSGGREHALAKKILESPQTRNFFVAPGNAGIAQEAECIPLEPTDSVAVIDFVKSHAVDLVVVGPEAPLVEGIADQLRERGVRVFGPCAKAAQLEGSKAFMKSLAQKQKIPTACFETFSDPFEARKSLLHRSYPLVVKADGLAAGKGVLICQNQSEAESAIQEILEEKVFGKHQSQIVIEDFLRGEEASFIGVTDGKTFLPFASSQDHKRIGEGDTGPNTGGMGAYSPTPLVTEALQQKVIQTIVQPTLQGLREQSISYQGVLYAGLMIDQQSPSLLEYNVRFGDPECQVLLPRLRSDFVELMLKVVDGDLASYKAEWDPRVAVCVVLAAEGYPGNYSKGEVIEGLPEATALPDTFLFHAGTSKKEGRWVTNGGRVLGVTALGETLKHAIQKAYQAVEKIHWRGMNYRKDIGAKGLK